MSDCHETPQCSPVSARLPVIALAGNPNCGKTTLFNLLTGAHQHVGNWPGVTVERRSGTMTMGRRKISVVDLPGVYSLMGGGGEDQRVARDFLLDSDIELIVNIVDASNLERHMALTAELLETGRPMVLVLNMVDEAEAHGLQVRSHELSAALGVPVIPMVARKARGRTRLMETLTQALGHPALGNMLYYGQLIEAALTAIGTLLPGDPPAHRRFNALCLLEGNTDPTDPKTQHALQQISSELAVTSDETPADLIMDRRFAWAQEMAGIAMHRQGPAGLRQKITDRLDRVVLNDWLGVPVFLAVLYLVFVVSFSGGNILLDFFDQASATLLIHGVGHLLLGAGLPTWLISIIAGGIGGGLNLVVSFIPPIGLTFLFLAFLDDSGYMARAAYAMDRLMRRMGLPGNALVPMVIGFGCNVPAIVGTHP